MSYQLRPIQRDLFISHLVTIHYFEYSNHYEFSGEAHDFWEFLYVDKGKVLVSADQKHYELENNEIIFHHPNQFHTVKSNGVIAPNLIVVSFKAEGKLLNFFKNKITRLNPSEINKLCDIMNLAYQTYDVPLDEPSLLELIPYPNKSVDEAIIVNLLENFLYSIYQNERKAVKKKVNQVNEEKNNLEIIDSYINRHLQDYLNSQIISRETYLSLNQVNKLIRDHYDMTPHQYVTYKKLEYAKILIRETDATFTEISDCLGYNSIHYFSKLFKKHFQMTPTEYSKSIKVRLIK